MTILLASHTEDVHSLALERALGALGAEVFRFNTNDFPERVRLTLEVSDVIDGEIDATAVGLGKCRLRNIDAAIYRRPEPPRFTEPIAPLYVEFCKEETASALDAVWNALRFKWLNDPFTMRRARDKALQLGEAHRVGLQTPETFITNDPQTVPRYSGGTIYKTLRAAAIEDRAHMPLGVFTTEVAEALRRELTRLRFAPGIFQPLVAKAYELRVTVCGEQLVACRIDSQDNPAASLDWRVVDPASIPHQIVALRCDIADRLFRLLKNLELRFACIDMIVTPDDEYVFLEANPNGQWLWIEQLTGAPIASMLAETLLSIATH